MALIKSISGIRGTIGGRQGDGLNPIDIAKFASAYGTYIKSCEQAGKRTKVVVGRDARISGHLVNEIVVQSLLSLGIDVIEIGLASTPTTEIAVVGEQADGGIIITASHNPRQWNALKLLNSKGEFLNDEQGRKVLEIAESGEIVFADIDNIGKRYYNTTYSQRHIEQVLSLDLVDCTAIESADFTVAIDAVNSVGGVVVPELLAALGVKNIIKVNCTPDGNFAHNPEPIPQNLTEIAEVVRSSKADVGFVVDPDVDRLAIVMENGEMFVEEYTLVAVADYVLSHTPGATVSNLSSSRALRDITLKYGCSYTAAAVGEVNVVKAMRDTNAIIGGEGNGGVIYPTAHSGRDALVGIALFLSLLAKSGKTVTELKAGYPQYEIVKDKITLSEEIDVDAILQAMKDKFINEKVTDIDGVKIDFEDSWVHLRKSNTEPIIRIYAEAENEERAQALVKDIKKLISSIA